MSIEQNTQTEPSNSRRKVWIINLLEVPNGDNPNDYVYEENFRGTKIRIKPGRVKEFCELSASAAVRFLSQVVPLHEPNPDGTFYDENGNVDKSRFGKPLKIIELTNEERAELGIDMDLIPEDELNAYLAGKDHTGGKSDVEAVGKGKPQARVIRKAQPNISMGEIGTD